MSVRVLTILLAATALSGCAVGPDGRQAQALLERAQAEQLKLRTATFSAELAVTAEGKRFGVSVEGGAALRGRHAGDVFVRMVGTGEGDAFEMSMVKRGSRVTVTADGQTQTFMAGDPAAPKFDGVSSLSSFDFAECIEDVDVAEGRSIGGERATRIAGTVDTVCVLKAASALSDVAGSSPRGFDFDALSKYVDDVRATLFVSERSHLLVGALVTTKFHVLEQSADVQLRYRLTRVNQRLRFPADV
jgi:hypothetical protein